MERAPDRIPTSLNAAVSPRIPPYVNSLYLRIIAWSESFVASPRWVLKVFLLSLTVSILFSGGVDMRFVNDGPGISDNNGNAYGYSEGYYKKIENPWVDLTKYFRTGSHDAKLNLRLTVPVVLHYLGVRSPYALPMLTIAAICTVLLLSCLFAFEVTGDRVTSLFVSLGVASTYAGSFAVISYYDAIAFAQLLLALMPRLKPWLKGVLVFTASFTDERAFVASAFLLLPALCLHCNRKGSFFARLLQLDFLAVAFGMSACGLARFLLHHFVGLSTPTTGVNFTLFFIQIKFLHIGTWYALEGGWLLVGLALLVLWRQRYGMALGIFLFVLIALLTGSFMVADITRSAAYLFPAALVSLMILAEREEVDVLRGCCFLAFLISLAGGNYGIGGDQIRWFQPLSVSILELLGQFIFAHR